MLFPEKGSSFSYNCIPVLQSVRTPITVLESPIWIHSLLRVFFQKIISKLFVYFNKSLYHIERLSKVAPASLQKSISVMCNILELEKKFPVQEIPPRGCFSWLQMSQIRLWCGVIFSFSYW